MRRTQLYLDDHIWTALRARAESERTTISELVRKAIRERYIGDMEKRRSAMQRFVGLRNTNARSRDATVEVRTLRRGNRLNRRLEGQ